MDKRVDGKCLIALVQYVLHQKFKEDSIPQFEIQTKGEHGLANVR